MTPVVAGHEHRLAVGPGYLTEPAKIVEGDWLHGARRAWHGLPAQLTPQRSAITDATRSPAC
ncbi:MAG: hypothetical protein ACXVHQ_40855, partial [Solirubrobacteraceae bacterium]